MRYWVRFLIFDENQSGMGNHQGGTIRDGVSGSFASKRATNPVPNGSLRKLPTYDKHDKLEAGDK